MTTDADLLWTFCKEVDKNVSELTFFANCYKAFIICYGYIKSFLGSSLNSKQESCLSSVMENELDSAISISILGSIDNDEKFIEDITCLIILLVEWV